MLGSLQKIIRKNNTSLNDEDILQMALAYSEFIKNGNYNFSSSTRMTLTQGSKKRIVYSFDKNSIEHILCGYLKEILDSYFNVKYSCRSKIINMLFNTLPVIKDLNDFVIIRYDFKSFFDSVSTKFIYKNYIENSSIQRVTKKIFSQFCNCFKYCFAGLNTSNPMTEIACRDFDKVLRAKLEPYGAVYCQRYVDDALIILNSYISEDEFRRLIDDSINEVFIDCKVKLNESKFNYIARRSIQNTQCFDFLGYNFTINFDSNPNCKSPFTFKFGIAEKKQKKYKARIRQLFNDFILNQDVELLRHRIKAFSTRIVYTFPINDGNYNWISKGVISNYNELRYHLSNLDSSTEDFLKNVYFHVMDELEITKQPYYFYENELESSYNLFSTMKRNRSMIFDPKIGLKINQLVREVRKIVPEYNPNRRTYFQITKDYLDQLKVQ